MDLYTIIAFILGVAIVALFFIIKNKKLIKADKIASRIIAALQIALTKFAKEIKEYDLENNTDYFETLQKTLKKIEEMSADENITPLEFAQYVIDLYADISVILENVNILDKVVTVEIKG